MGCADQQLALFEAIGRIERSILPTASTLLDTLLDAAALARPGVDAALHSDELRRIAAQLEELTRELDALIPGRTDVEPYRAASAA